MTRRERTLRRLQRSDGQPASSAQRSCANPQYLGGMRASAAAVAALFALVLAGPAAAQAPPPDERAAAQALADAAKRLIAADREVGEDHDPDDGLDSPHCRRELFR